MSPPLNPTVVDGWRAALEAVACGPVDRVWSGLWPVIEDMRAYLGLSVPSAGKPDSLTSAGAA
jgi:hypothetical protein